VGNIAKVTAHQHKRVILPAPAIDKREVQEEIPTLIVNHPVVLPVEESQVQPLIVAEHKTRKPRYVELDFIDDPVTASRQQAVQPVMASSPQPIRFHIGIGNTGPSYTEGDRRESSFRFQRSF
jgi:hypothetical protein